MMTRRVRDLIRLLRAGPRAPDIFLRREYDRLGAALARLARAYRRTWVRRTRVVAVVGSLGKTTTRRALSAALGCPERGFSHSNYGASLAANLLRVRRGDAHAVLEAGVSGPGPMAGYARMLRPDVVVVTAIKSEHNRSFPTLFDTRAEKVNMVRALPPHGVAVLNGDDPHVCWMATQTRARVLRFGRNAGNDLRATAVEETADGTAFTAERPGGAWTVKTRFLGGHMVYPFLAALAVAELEGVPPQTALARLAALAPADSRMELLHLPGGITVLDDSFKGTLESVHAALDALAALPAVRKFVLFGGIEEPPGPQGGLNREIGRRLGRIAHAVLCVGGHGLSGIRAGAVEAGLPHGAVHLLNFDLEAAAGWLQRALRPGDALLIKGQSTQRLRRVVLRLQGHPVSCAVSRCTVKAPSCEACPLLNAPPDLFRNHYVARYLRA